MKMCKFHYHRQHRGVPLDAPVLRKNGAGHIAKNGYHRLVVDGRQMFGHTLAVERLIGRVLLPGETVHHRNGQKADNSVGPCVLCTHCACPDGSHNLELWSSHQPPGQRVVDKVRWAREILALYGHLYPEKKSG